MWVCNINQDSKRQDLRDAARELVCDAPTLAEYIVRIFCCVGIEGDDLQAIRVSAGTIGPFAAQDRRFTV
jgi:hypothetical protein